MRRGCAVFAALLIASGADAQVARGTIGGEAIQSIGIDARDAENASLWRGARGGDTAFERCPSPEATFEVEAPDLPREARRALDRALDVWSCRISSPVPIRLEVRWVDLPSSRLGSAGPRVALDADPALASGSWYAFALADALTGRDLVPGMPDIEAEFNRSYTDWHFDPDQPPPPEAFDFATVALHEIGHGLGLLGALRVADGRGEVEGPGGGTTPLLYDRFTRDRQGQSLLDATVYPAPSVLLADVLTSEVVFDGRATRAASGAEAILFAPEVWSEGGSYDHLEEALYAASTPEGLMTPFLARGERIAAPGATTCGMLGDLGWPLAGDCAAAVGVLAPLASGVTARRTGPNPFRDVTSVEIEVGEPQEARVALVDALGRRVQTLAQRSLVPGETLRVYISAAGLASGVYAITITTGDSAMAVPVVVLR